MDNSINKLHMAPRLTAGGRPYALRRGTILDAESASEDVKVRVFPGPGQDPQAAEGGGNYRVPGDWIPEGYALRRPQVVWLDVNPRSRGGTLGIEVHNEDPTLIYGLTANFVFYNGEFDPGANPPFGAWAEDFDDYVRAIYTDGSFSNARHQVHNPVGGAPEVTDTFDDFNAPHPEPWYKESIPGLDAPVTAAIQAAFAEVIAAVMAARPGLTWVRVANAGVSFGDVDLYQPHQGPTMSEPFFGTNFLHITINPDVPDAGDLDDDVGFNVGLQEIALFAREMAGFAVRIYGEDTFGNAGSPSLPTIPYFPFTDPGLPAPMEGLEPATDPVNPPDNQARFVPWDDNSSLAYAVKAARTAAIDGDNAIVAGINNLVSTTDDTENANLLAFARASADFADVTYQGDDGDTITAEDLESLIAEHYGYSA